MTTMWKELFSFIMVKEWAVLLSWVFTPVWRVVPHTVCRGCRTSCSGPGCHGNQHWPILPSWWWLGPGPSWLLSETESSGSQAAPDDQHNQGSGGQKSYLLSLGTCGWFRTGSGLRLVLWLVLRLRISWTVILGCSALELSVWLQDRSVSHSDSWNSDWFCDRSILKHRF